MPPAAVGWLLAEFTVLSMAAALITRIPTAGAVGVAGAAGVVNGRAWYGVTRAFATTGAPILRRRRRPPVAMAATAATIGAAIIVTRAAFAATTPDHEDWQRPALYGQTVRISHGFPRQAGAGWPVSPLGGDVHPPPTRRLVVMVVPGFGSACCSRASSPAQMMPRARVQSFSYRGLARAGQPLPYGPDAGDLPLPVLGDRLAAQVWRLHRATGQPVDIVAESEGTLGVDAMLARHPGVPVGSLVLLSPIVGPGRYDCGSGEGPRFLPWLELRGVIWFTGGLSPYGVSGSQALIGSVYREGRCLAVQADGPPPAPDNGYRAAR